MYSPLNWGLFYLVRILYIGAMAAKKKQTVEHTTLHLSELSANPDNPRQITKDKYDSLKKSLSLNPEFLEAKRVIVDENYLVLGGNMRLRALREMGVERVPVTIITGLTEQKKRELVIVDNAQHGNWDWDQIANNDWTELDLEMLGLDVWNVDKEDVSEFFEDFEPVEKKNVKTLTLTFDPETYERVMALLKASEDPYEQVILKALGL